MTEAEALADPRYPELVKAYEAALERDGLIGKNAAWYAQRELMEGKPVLVRLGRDAMGVWWRWLGANPPEKIEPAPAQEKSKKTRREARPKGVLVCECGHTEAEHGGEPGCPPTGCEICTDLNCADFEAVDVRRVPTVRDGSVPAASVEPTPTQETRERPATQGSLFS